MSTYGGLEETSCTELHGNQVVGRVQQRFSQGITSTRRGEEFCVAETPRLWATARALKIPRGRGTQGGGEGERWEGKDHFGFTLLERKFATM